MGFLGVEDLLGFFERFGITGQSDPASRAERQLAELAVAMPERNKLCLRGG